MRSGARSLSLAQRHDPEPPIGWYSIGAHALPLRIFIGPTGLGNLTNHVGQAILGHGSEELGCGLSRDLGAQGAAKESRRGRVTQP